ncbi:DUF6257 family protein [Streptomyces cavernae]|uniref:DUF6257 family protein n=1 Tax=Streptomyces cavernae TaxID=2259034 RepID=UPI0012D9CF87|nr:DUF6257 family protein [Streptomyces cavernae]
MPEPKLTFTEKVAIVRLEMKGLKRAAAGITDQPDIDAGIQRIKDRARKRAANGK